MRILRVIARMNVGGPAYHVSLLSGQLDNTKYQTLLVTGEIGPGEQSFNELARRYGADLKVLPSLGPEIKPWADLKSLFELIRVIRSFQPDIIHTHTAKAGVLGRIAALGGMRSRRPILIHTYHGHVLEGYFGRTISFAYRLAERILARRTDCLIGVSDATVNDLVRLRVAPRSKFRVVPLGLELDRFSSSSNGATFRNELGITNETVLLTFVGRLVPIKRVDMLLHALAQAREHGDRLHLAVVGDGNLRPQLEQLAQNLGLANAVTFTGYRSDIATVVAATDIAVLTSKNEGTPVALIEAAAAGKPAIATAVGGVASVVTPETGILVNGDDIDGFSTAIQTLANNAEQRDRLGAAAQKHVLKCFSATRLVADMERLYMDLLSRNGPS